MIGIHASFCLAYVVKLMAYRDRSDCEFVKQPMNDPVLSLRPVVAASSHVSVTLAVKGAFP